MALSLWTEAKALLTLARSAAWGSIGQVEQSEIFRGQETERRAPLVHMTRRGTAPIFGESGSRMASASDQAPYEHD